MEPNVKPSRWRSHLRTAVIGRNPRFTLVRIVGIVTVIFLVREFALLPIKVMGQSMMPTYQDHGVNFVNRLAYLSHVPQRGDVVAIRYAGQSVMLMKRIVGLPGESIAFHRGRVMVNGQLLDEPYMKYDCDWEIAPVTIGPDDFFVVGDNRSMPPESHLFGETERKRIVGKILLCKNLFASSVRSH